MSGRIKVLLVEDHTIVREGIRLILEGQSDIQVIGEAANGEEAVTKALELRPDVIIMDITMPGMDGLQATRHIRRQLPEAQIVALTVHTNEVFFFRMLAAGASGYVLKGAPSSELLAAVRAAFGGQVFLPPSLAGRLVAKYVRQARQGEMQDTYEALTERERETLKLLADGLTLQEIARRLSVSLSTVQTHRAHIMEKLGLQNRAELIKYALSQGLIEI